MFFGEKINNQYAGEILYSLEMKVVLVERKMILNSSLLSDAYPVAKDFWVNQE